MQVASMELCKELFELSRWGDTHLFYTKTGKVSTEASMFSGEPLPAYDLGYLIRKLPASVKIELAKRVYYDDDDHWSVDLTAWLGDSFFMTDDFRSNEDAIATLAIQLFKDKELTI